MLMMRLLGPKSFPELLKIFDEENSVKDGWYAPNSNDTWPRQRFNEANSQFGEWNEFELSHTDLLDVKLHWNTGFGIPQEGMVVAEALRLPLFRSWIAKDEHKIYLADSHVWLASEPLRDNPPIEHTYLKNYEGHLVTLDGIHRLLLWAEIGKQTTRAFIAGKQEGKLASALPNIGLGAAGGCSGKQVVSKGRQNSPKFPNSTE
jgi:hypothetical protein